MPATRNAGAGPVNDGTFDFGQKAFVGDHVRVVTNHSEWSFVKIARTSFDSNWVARVIVSTDSTVGAPTKAPTAIKVQRYFRRGQTVTMTDKTTGDVQHVYVNGVQIF